MKRLCLVLCSLFLLLGPSALSQGEKVVVIADSAHIYAEPDSSSYMIETVSRGAVLTLLQRNKVRGAWYYVAFDSKSRKGKVSGFIHDTLVEDSQRIQKSMRVGQISGKKENLSISSPPRPENVALSTEKRAVPEERVEELSVTLPSKPEAFQVIAPSAKEAAIFQEISKPAVEITPKEIKLGNASHVREDRVFQSIIEPLVWIKARNMPSVKASSSVETAAYQAKKASKPVRVEELSITPFFREGALASAGVRTEESRGDIGSTIPLMASPTKNLVAFREIATLPVEIVNHDLPTINPPSEMESIVFQKKRKAAQLSEDKRMSFTEASPSRKVVTLERIPRGEPKGKESPQEHEIEPIPTSAKKDSRKFKWITLGLGYGQSLGGAGGFIQLNTKWGLSFHGGAGYYPTSYIYSGCDWVKDVTLFTGGIKYYLPFDADPFRFYLDLQYGGIGVEATQIVNGIWQYNFVFDYKQKTLWGPSFLGGLELRLGSLGLNGAVGLSCNTTNLDWNIQDYFLTFDLGLLLYF